MYEHDIAARQLSNLSIAPARPAHLARAAVESAGEVAACRLGDGACAAAQASHVNRSAGVQGPALHRSLLQLQRRHGNQFVGQVLRQAAGGEHEGGGMDAVERSIDGARGAGQGMDHGTRSRMEGAFSADFSGVRIHDDARANGLSQSLSARAFTTGRDVFFRQGEYSPGTSSGRELLAHELTHVVQQNGDGIRTKMTVSEPGDPQEVEADQMARAVIDKEQSVQRQPEAPKREEEDKQLAAKQDAAHALQRQPEAPKMAEEEEEKLRTKPAIAGVSRQVDDAGIAAAEHVAR